MLVQQAVLLVFTRGGVACHAPAEEDYKALLRPKAPAETINGSEHPGPKGDTGASGSGATGDTGASGSGATCAKGSGSGTSASDASGSGSGGPLSALSEPNSEVEDLKRLLAAAQAENERLKVARDATAAPVPAAPRTRRGSHAIKQS